MTFDKRAKMIQVLNDLTKEEVIGFYQGFLLQVGKEFTSVRLKKKKNVKRLRFGNLDSDAISTISNIQMH